VYDDAHHKARESRCRLTAERCVSFTKVKPVNLQRAIAPYTLSVYRGFVL